MSEKNNNNVIDEAPKVFIAYSHKDKSDLEELRAILTPLTRNKKLKVWFDGEIRPGSIWDVEIKASLYSADIILLLLSPNSLSSDYFYEKEVLDALERHRKNEARVVPIILRPCLWDETPLHEIQALPNTAKPISLWLDKDSAWESVARGLKIYLEEIEAIKRELKINGGGELSIKLNKPSQNNPPKIIFSKPEIKFRLEMIFVQGGNFMMGNDEESTERPVHKVNLKDFHIGKYPITQTQWQKIMGNNPSTFVGDNLPVDRVNWDECQDFCKKISNIFNKRFRLPTESEWEYAAQGGNQSRLYEFSGSNYIDDVAWYWGNSGDTPLSGIWSMEKVKSNNCMTHAVGSKKPNELGIYDMSGNVQEWCEDIWHGNYNGAPKDGSAWLNWSFNSKSRRRVHRGGSFSFLESTSKIRFRSYDSPYSNNWGNGFRIVLQEGL